MTERTSCYALEAMSSAAPMRTEFGLGAMRTWLSEFRRLKLEHAVPQLIVKLDRLSRVAMTPVGRCNLLRELERPVLKAVAALPKLVDEGREQDQNEASTLLLEQRLYCLMIKNLKQLLRDLDDSIKDNSIKVDKRRGWALHNLFSFLGRQIELSLFWGQPLPRHTWAELHDLYAYVVERGIVSLVGRSLHIGHSDDFDPEREYKRLLLLGLAGRLLRNRPWSDLVKDKIDSWVADTSLQNPVAFAGETGLYVVETSKDAPPRQLQEILTESFCGWVLMRPAGFLTDVVANREVRNLDPARGHGIELRA